MIKFLIFYVSALNIFFPKISLLGISFYIYELFIFILAILYSQLIKKIYFNFTRAYLYYLFFLFLSIIVGLILHLEADLENIFKFIRYFYLFFFLYLSFQFGHLFNEDSIKKILFFNFLFCFIFGLWVVLQTLILNLNSGQVVWIYSLNSRLIGFTGLSWDIFNNRVFRDGNTSVQMGVYTSLFFSIFFYRFAKESNFKFLFISLFFLIFTSLTFSRTGMLSLAISFIFILINNKNFKTIRILCFIIFLVSIAYINNLINFIFDWGIFTKYRVIEDLGYDPTADRRIMLWLKSLNVLSNQPLYLIFGSGFSDTITTKLIGVDINESLIFITFLQSGIFAGVFLILTFLFYYIDLSRILKNRYEVNIYHHTLKGIQFFIPGFFIANLVGGNSFQSDFISPIIFCLTGICLKNIIKKNSKL